MNAPQLRLHYNVCSRSARCLARLVLLFFVLASAPGASAQQWELVWSDEFDTEGLPDPGRWAYDVGGHGWGNQEAQYYTANRSENARVEDGRLIIEARREDFTGNDYTSARLLTRGKASWTYGRFEVRAKLPAGRGTWPAIWMLAENDVYGDAYWPDNGEIDIMEYVGYQPGIVHGTIHTFTNNHQNGRQSGDSFELPTAETAFHTYAVEWTPEQIRFYVDDELYHTYTNTGLGWRLWPFDQPFFLILNVAVGGTWGGQQGIDETAFPTRMEVEYVRVYKDVQGFPSITLTAPTSAQSLEEGGTLALAAEAADEDGEVTHVAFLQGDGILGIDMEPPYTLTLDGLSAGCYRVASEATDDSGRTTRSAYVDVTVGDGSCGQAPYLMMPVTLPGRVEAENYDLGGSNVAYRDLDQANAGGVYRTDEGVDVSPTGDGGFAVSSIATREWVAYTVDVAAADTYRLEARVRGEGNGGAFQVSVDGTDETGTVTFDAAEGWQTVSVDDFALEAGVHTLRVNMRASGFEIDYFEVDAVVTSAGRDEHPRAFVLHPNFPNPFNPSTTIAFELASATAVEVAVYDVFGRRVAQLVDGYRASGTHRLRFDAAGLPSATYFVQVRTADGIARHPITLLK